MKKLALVLGVVAVGCVLGGCTSYHKITEVGSGKTFYTSELHKRGKHSDATEFKDAATGAEVTLQSAEVMKISEDDFKRAVPKPAK